MKIIFGKYIVMDPDILVGKLIIKNTRIPIDLILKKLSENITIDELLMDYPRLKKEHIQEILSYAHSMITKEQVYSLSK